MERITTGDVGKAFTAFMRTAERLGFNTQGWKIYQGTSGVPYELVREEYVPTEGTSAHSRRISSTEFPRVLGTGTRQVYGTLTAYTAALHAVEVMRQASITTLAQRYPGDKWRWTPGGAYGRRYCELYRIPRDGSQEFVSYGQSIDCRAAQVNILCGQLNDSLRMGGMLADKPEWLG